MSLFAGLLLFSTVDVKASEPAAQAKKVFMFLDGSYSEYKQLASNQKVFDQANACLLTIYIKWIESMIYLTGDMVGVENENREFAKLAKQKKKELQEFVNMSVQNGKIYSAVKAEIDRMESKDIITGGRNMSANEFLNADFTEAEREFSLCLEDSFIKSISKK